MRWAPSISDWLFLALLAVALLRPGGPSDLLLDGDAGWHIRTGEAILASGRVPATDSFSYSLPGGQWFAWEWLADVIFAALHHAWGLAGVAGLAGILVALPPVLLFRRMEWEGAGIPAALGIALLAAGASAVHSLARPHLFTYALLPAALWLLEADRRRPGHFVWLLAPLTALWVNLHGGFLALLIAVGFEAGAAAFTSRPRARRLGLLFALCLAASLLNPYGWTLHRHIAEYVRAGWIRNLVEEFQAPRFRSEAALDFLALLLAGLMAVPRLWTNGARGQAATLVFWAQAALQSARHIPIYAICAAPVLASVWGRQLPEWASPRYPRRSSVPALALGTVAILAAMGPARFPAARFPAAAVEKHEHLLRGRRVLTSDQWGDYLLYRWPGQRVFFDGRTDYYGPVLAQRYASLMTLQPGWERWLDEYRFEAALLPRDWPLEAVLSRDGKWEIVHRDSLATILTRQWGRPLTVSVTEPRP